MTSTLAITPNTTTAWHDPLHVAGVWLCGHGDGSSAPASCVAHSLLSIGEAALMLFILTAALRVRAGSSHAAAPELQAHKRWSGSTGLRACCATSSWLLTLLLASIPPLASIGYAASSPSRGAGVAVAASILAWGACMGLLSRHLRRSSDVLLPDYFLWWMVASAAAAALCVAITAPAVPTALEAAWAARVLAALPPAVCLIHDAVARCRAGRSGEDTPPRDAAPFLSRLFFMWMNGLMRLGASRPLDACDLPPLTADDDIARVAGAFTAAAEQDASRPGKTASLVRTLVRAYSGTFAVAAGFKLTFDTVQYAGPLLLHALIEFLDDSARGGAAAPPLSLGLTYVALMLVSNTLQTLLLHQYFFRVFKVGQHVRTAVVLAVYRKSLRMSLAARTATSVGTLTNLMSTDAKRLQDLQTYLMTVISGPWQITLALLLLWQQLGVSVLAGVAVMLLFLPVNAGFARWQQKLQSRVMDIRDTRINQTNEALQAFRMVKYHAWEDFFTTRVGDTRAAELRCLLSYQLLAQAAEILWLGLPLMVTLASIGTYALLHGGPPAASALFTALALFQMLRFPMSMFPTVVTSLVEARVSVQRLQSFLDAEEVSPPLRTALDPVTDASALVAAAAGSVDSNTVVIEVPSSAVFAWTDAAAAAAASSPASSQAGPPAPPKADKRALLAPSGAAPRVSIDGDDDEEIVHLNGPASTSVGFRLHGCGLKVPRGALVCVCGAVGSGKSSLLLACLHEMRSAAAGGDAKVTLRGTVAYVPQSPFILNASVKDNIVFGRAWDPVRYADAVRVCELAPDLRILPAGDDTEIGEKGVNLSGGQQTRVALARAVYADADVYLLDDVLAAVDAHVGAALFYNCISTFLAGKTRVLVTHALQYSVSATSVVVMADGRIAERGTYRDLRTRGGLFAHMADTAQLQRSRVPSADASAACPDAPHAHVPTNAAPPTASIVENGNGSGSAHVAPRRDSIPEEAGAFVDVEGAADVTDDKQLLASTQPGANTRTMTTEARERGTVRRHVYAAYMRAIGGPSVAVVLVALFIGFQGLSIGSGAWLSRWSAAAGGDGASSSSSWYLSVYVALNLISLVILVVERIMVACAGVRAARSMHERLLFTLLRTPLSFMDTTPVGRILNRCSQDVNVVDEQLPETYSSFLGCLVVVLGTLVLICAVTPLFLLALPPLAVFYYFTQRYYVATSRELQRLDSMSRSPIFAHFGETLHGLITIRAFGDQDRFWDRTQRLLDANLRAYFCSTSSNRWLAVRLETVGAVITASAALFAVLAAGSSTREFAAFAGLSISTALGMTQTLNWLVRMASDAESQTVAVERIEEYCALPREPDLDDVTGGCPQLPSGWPSRGDIVVTDLRLRYRKDTPEVLHGVTCAIQGGEHIGICGRTGAGKSSLVSCLLRTADVQGGVITIDGVDISSLPRRLLRSHVTLIPQTPVLFAASVRRNLDVLSAHTDEQVWTALGHVGMRDAISALPARLEAPVADGGANFSAGQRQLLTIARALLRKSRIFVLDETSSSIDVESDALLQRVIATELKTATTLTIAHRLHTIMGSDRIMVLNDGNIAELDAPASLLAREAGEFAGMAREAGLLNRATAIVTAPVHVSGAAQDQGSAASASAAAVPAG